MKSKLGKNEFLSIWILLFVLAAMAVVVMGLWYHSVAVLPDNVGRQLSPEETEAVIADNSPLADYVYLSPSADFPRGQKISKITIHHMASDLDLEVLGQRFGYRDRKASSNYAIDRSGRVALYVEECNRAWTSSSKENDDMAVTIEVANQELGGEWSVSNESYSALIDLCVDICRRNNISELVYTGDAEGNLTIHKMFNPKTQCPGPYLEKRMPEIAKTVNDRLSKMDN